MQEIPTTILLGLMTAGMIVTQSGLGTDNRKTVGREWPPTLDSIRRGTPRAIPNSVRRGTPHAIPNGVRRSILHIIPDNTRRGIQRDRPKRTRTAKGLSLRRGAELVMAVEP